MKRGSFPCLPYGSLFSAVRPLSSRGEEMPSRYLCVIFPNIGPKSSYIQRLLATIYSMETLVRAILSCFRKHHTWPLDTPHISHLTPPIKVSQCGTHLQGFWATLYSMEALFPTIFLMFSENITPGLQNITPGPSHLTPHITPHISYLILKPDGLG